MDIKGFIESSLLEWEGRLASVAFVQGCNLRCRYCHAGDLLRPGALPTVPREQVLGYLRRQSGWIDGLAITGGEPTLHGQGLLDFIAEVRALDVEVMVETNGTQPDWVERLISEGWVQALAMDVKAPLTVDDYRRITNCEVNVDDVRRSIRRIIDSHIPHEFRCTVVPGLIGREDLDRIAAELVGADTVALQNFEPAHCLDPALHSVEPYMPEEMDELAQAFQAVAGRVLTRGRERALALRGGG